MHFEKFLENVFCMGCMVLGGFLLDSIVTRMCQKNMHFEKFLENVFCMVIGAWWFSIGFYWIP
jgi:hypothetical protein